MSIDKLKSHLGKQLGLRKNKFLLELPRPGIDAEKFDILCSVAQMPARTMETPELFFKGRKYRLRSEIDFTGSIELTIIDDDKMSIRKALDRWLKEVDDTNVPEESRFGFVNTLQSASESISSITGLISEAEFYLNNPLELIASPNLPKYQTEINIFQLSRTNEKVYGYKLENAFISGIGEITYSDAELNTLTEYNITISFSEFTPISGGVLGAVDDILGTSFSESATVVEELFD